MPEYHPGTDIVIPDNVPLTPFRNAIPNPKRYMKHNLVSISQVCEAAYTGDYDKLEEMLATGNEKQLYNGDLNAHVSSITALHMAAMTGQLECVELLLKARADPHIKECMPHGQDPEDGRTALDCAREAGQDEVVELLEKAEKSTPYGFYVPYGQNNNAKVYGTWEWKTKPPKGFFSSRPGAAEKCGFDPMKYGTGPLPDDDEEDFVDTGAIAGPAKPKALPSRLAPPPVNAALLFPGQGSQYVKMLDQCKDNPRVMEMCEKAKAILGWDLLGLCLNGPSEELASTRCAQPALFVGGLAGLELLRQRNPDVAERFKACAGLSLGEYTALCAAGVFTFEDGLQLVKLRGQYMAEAAEHPKQLMVSIAGLEKGVLEKLCQQAMAKEGPQAVCQIANELFPKGYACAGTEVSINTLRELADKEGALQAKVLQTSGAFHTALMQPAKDRLSQALDDMLPRMSSPRAIVYMNVTAQPIYPGTEPREIVELLKRQLTSPVLWHTSVQAMIKSGITEYYEVGPMKQLKAMMKRIDQKIWNTTYNMEV